jgi:hypothetical protein
VSLIGKIYRRNIYGVIGTLVFHILLVSTFLLADVDKKGNVREEVLLIEFPELPPEPEIIEEEIDEQQNEESIEEMDKLNNRTNTASNQLANQNTTKSAEEFFDDDLQKEIEEAKRLSSNASSQLAKKVVDIEDIKMPVVTTEGMEPDSIKNVIYSGESNIEYFLENRYHVRLPNPLYLSHGGGKVIVNIEVNNQGVVVKASPQKNRKIRDENVFIYAKTAALGTVFNVDETAPSPQKGSIHYSFIAQ